MWKLLVILNLFAIAQCCRVIEQKANGIEQTRSAFTSHVFLETFITYDQKYMCSGVLVSANYVLTTRNCVFGMMFVNVHVYAHKLRDVFENEREIYRATEAVYKPDFDGLNSINDVALVKLPTPLNVAARPYSIAQLPDVAQLLLPGTEGRLVGWGLLDHIDDNAAAFKHAQVMRVVSEEVCREAYPNKWSSSSEIQGRVCVQRNFGKNCVGDDGSPFFIGDVVYGIQSFGQKEACDEAYPNGIQDIRYHVDWINSVIQSPIVASPVF